MSAPETEFTKEKVLLPDGRYLVYYDFKPESGPDQSNQSTEKKGEKNV